jgi:hypothetical protein
LDSLAGYLLPVSTLYLALPHLIFYFGWLRWPLALLATGAICVALVKVLELGTGVLSSRDTTLHAMRSIDDVQADAVSSSMANANHFAACNATSDAAGAFLLTRQHALIIGAIGLMWLTISGVGGFVHQDHDWDKHNVVLNSLITQPWPTVYEIYQENIPLVYYIGYYLPAALVGKVGGWFWANQALFLWSLLGLMVALLWFCILVRRVSYSVLLIFVLFSGLDVIGKELATYGGMWNAGKATWQHLDPWANIWQYSSNSTLLFWVPHQALAGWIMTGMILYCLVMLRRRELILLPLGLSAFWSPFITLGIVPYLVLDFLIDKEPLALRFRRMISLPNLAGLLALGMTGLYFSSKIYEGSPVVIRSLFGGLSLPHYDGSTFGAVTFLILFCLLEFGVYAIMLYRSGAIQDERWRWMLDITVLTLFILPWFRLGVYNDLVMRASIPALFVLAVIVARAIHDNTLTKQTRMALTIVLLVGAVTSGAEIRRHLYWMTTESAPIMDETKVPGDFISYFQDQAFFFGQYAGGIDSPFFQYAAKIAPASTTHELNEHDYILFDNRIYLLRDQIELAAEIAPGATFTVPLELHFYGPAIRTSYEPDVRLVGEDDLPIWSIMSWPAEHPTTAPFAMTQWTGAITVTVPLTATPGLYHLQAGFYDGSTKEYLQAHSVPEGEPLGNIVSVGSTQIMPAR